MKNYFKVLWFSRHEMTEPQIADLKRIFGDNLIINQVSRTISSAFELQNEIAENDVIAIVAPINLQQQFLKLAGEKPVIIAKSKRLVTKIEGEEDKVEFIFRNWFQIKKIEVVLNRL